MMQSDLIINQVHFDPSQITESTKQVCDGIRKVDEEEKDIFGDAVKMRASRPTAGEQGGEYVHIESREPGRTIPCRVIRPTAEDTNPGIFLHFHGGGLAVGTHDRNDALLQRFADASGCVALSVGYLLAPEHPFPAPVQDCFDVADHLLKNGQEEFGGPLQFIGGESAGAYLTMQTFLHIAGTTSDSSSILGLVLTYGLYSWSFLPSNYTMRDTVCIDTAKTNIFRDLCFNMEPAQIPLVCGSFEREFGTLATHESPYDHDLKHPAASPLYRRLDDIGVRLPHALFLCGTADPTLDNTVLMSARWQMAGGLATTKFIAGAPHPFVELPIETGDCCVRAAEIIQQFIRERKS
ncbi:Alpha/Beta hydrolase protein [Dactylonectria macrodidyma]|uniref:Alpha/Beta hydrolase protein n=1 Tax=Dactylonectria macrodidyma TaxID=307937 RepID=A0A9P9DUW3_9HYPO|nr:Alpha/Beta hydrolase protein [Dactylonectria macrodidyma]